MATNICLFVYQQLAFIISQNRKNTFVSLKEVNLVDADVVEFAVP